jgi:hypothetical protein
MVRLLLAACLCVTVAADRFLTTALTPSDRVGVERQASLPPG